MTAPATADLIRRGEAFLSAGRNDLAERDLRDAVATSPFDAYAHSLLALALAAQGRGSLALQEAGEALRLEPEDEFAWYAVGVAQLSLGRYADAARSAHTVIRIQPRMPDGFRLLAQAELGRGDDHAALRAAEDGLAIAPDDLQLLKERQLALTAMGRLAEAAAVSADALRQDPTDAGAHAARGHTMLHSSQHREALEAFQEALRLDPGSMSARAGLAEAMKARHPIYGSLLTFLLWIQRGGPRLQIMLVAVAFATFRVLGDIAREGPGLVPFLIAAYIVYFGFILLTWIGPAVFDVVLRLDPVGRHILTPEDTMRSNIVGGLLATAAVLGVVGLVMGASAAIVIALGLLAVTIPVVSWFAARHGWPRWAMGACAVALGGLFYVTGLRLAGSSLSDLASSAAVGPLLLCLFATIGSTWVGWVVTTLRPAD